MTDEANCGCSALQFACEDGSCVDWFRKCDGVADCSDNSDEDRCEQPPEEQQFKCCDGNSIPGSQQCDATVHCPDGSDEFYCQTDSRIYQQKFSEK